MATDTELRRRVTRLENETGAIYEILAGVQSTLHDHTRRFEAMDQRFDTIDKRFDTMDQRFDTMDQRFNTVETTLVEVLRRLPDPS